MPPRKRYRFLSRLALAAVTLLLVGGVCEGLVRFLHLEEPRFIQRDPVYGSSHIPGQAGYWTKGVEPSYVKINSKGFRGPDRPYEKPPGVYRIVIIGDSYIEAFSVPFEKTLSNVLEEDLRSRGYPLEVVPLGMSNFGTAQELLLLEREGLRYHPDLVVLAFSHNDPSNNHPKLHWDTDRPYFRLAADGTLERIPFHLESKSRGAIRDFMRRRLRIYTFFPRRVREAVRNVRNRHPKDYIENPYQAYQLYPTASDPLGREAWELTFALLREFRRKTEAEGAEFALLDIPFRGQVTRRLWEEFLADYPQVERQGAVFERQEPQELLGGFCKREAARCLILLPIFRRAAAQGEELFGERDIHWNAEGNRLAADYLASLVEPLVRSAVQQSGP